MMKKEIGIEKMLEEVVVYYVKLMKESGFDGVVCLIFEVLKLCEVCGNEFVIVILGICFVSDDVND